MRALRIAALILAPALCLAGCRTATPAPDLQPSGAEASERMAPELSDAVHWTRNSAEHRALVVQTYRLAGEVLTAMAADLEPGTWAVALDADETVIDNSQFEKERAKSGGASPSWSEWVARREAPPLPGALGFLTRVRELGGKIAIVTNRRDEQCPDTEANFRAFSIPFDVMLCRREDERRKEGRWRQVEEGARGLPPLHVVMWLGDNIHDFPDLDQDVRNQPLVALERFGFRYFVLPNPMYGSWEDNPAD